VRDIVDRSDLKLIVEHFYSKARLDAQLGSVFAAAVADDDWLDHLELITDFWNSALFNHFCQACKPTNREKTFSSMVKAVCRNC